jgi:Glycosyl hydrolases family 16
MPTVPPVEPAPLGPPRDADGGVTGAPPPQGPRRRRRRRRYGRPAVIVATAVLSAVALVVALNAESSPRTAGSKLGADSALASPTVNIPSAIRTSAAPHKHAAKKAKAKPKTNSGSSANYGSGAAMPTGNLPGWNLVYATNFDGDSLPAGWGTYTGEPGGDNYGYWDPQNVSVSGGDLHLRTTPDSDPDQSGAATSGGVAFYNEPHTYGMYLVRMKGDYEPGLKMSDIALLWPADSGTWPPEIDFFEDNGGVRNGYTASLHPGPNGDDCCFIQNTISNNATEWHTYGVIWTADSLTYTIDGRVWGIVKSSQLTGAAHWPDIDMNLDLQSQNLGSAQPGSIETMTVDWVAEYEQS